MIRILLAIVNTLVGKAAAGSPRLVELAGAGALTVGMTMWLGGHAGWLTAGGLAMLKAWGDDVAAARDEKARQDR